MIDFNLTPSQPQTSGINRRVSTKRVLSDMADGRIFIGRQAIRAGLVDGVSTLPKIIEDIQKRSKPPAVTRVSQSWDTHQILPVNQRLCASQLLQSVSVTAIFPK